MYWLSVGAATTWSVTGRALWACVNLLLDCETRRDDPGHSSKYYYSTNFKYACCIAGVPGGMAGESRPRWSQGRELEPPRVHTRRDFFSQKIS